MLIFLSTITTLEEGELVRDCFTRFYERLYQHAYTQLRSHDDTEDTIQAAFVRISTYPKAFMAKTHKEPKRCLGYLITTLDNCCKNLYHQRDSRPEVLTDLSAPWLEAAVEAPDFRGPLHSLDLVVRILEQLTPQGREIMMLSFRGGYTAKEVAEILEISESNVNALIHRVRKKLLKEVQALETI